MEMSSGRSPSSSGEAPIRDDRRRQLAQVERPYVLAVGDQVAAGRDVDHGRPEPERPRRQKGAQGVAQLIGRLDPLHRQPDPPHRGLQRRAAVAQLLQVVARYHQVALAFDELGAMQVRAQPRRQLTRRR